MTHLRDRHALESFKNALAFSPITGVFGHRQTGKTTFLESFTKHYFTLDDAETLELINQSAKKFLTDNRGRHTAIDESQMSPALFPAIKEFVRTNKTPGDWILSGSVRFSSRQAIRESLTGRIVQIEMLPFVLTELAQESRARLVLQLLSGLEFPARLEDTLPPKIKTPRSKLVDQYQESGGLPGVCFMRNEKLREQRLSELMRLILDRDIRLVYPTSASYMQIESLLRILARSDGDILRPSILRKEVGFAETTIKKLLFALEATFVLRQMPVEGDRHGVAYFFEDQAACRLIAQGQQEEGQAFEGLVYRNLRASFFYETGLVFSFFQFREKSEVRIPFAVRTANGILGFIPTLDSTPTAKQLRMAGKFLQAYGNSKVLFVTKGESQTKIISNRILQIPCERILFE